MRVQKKYSKSEFYNEKLINIVGIRFTYREMDVLTCLASKLDEEKTSSILSISSKTIRVYLRNIRIKIGASSNESVLQFIKNSKQYSLILEYYKYINIESFFKKHLQNIGQKINPKMLSVSIKYKSLSNAEKDRLQTLSEHLKLANIHIGESHNQGSSPKSISISNNNTLKHNKRDIIIKLDNVDVSTNGQIEIIDLGSNYYESVFNLIEKLLKNSKIGNIRNEYKEDIQGFVCLEEDSKVTNQIYLGVILIFTACCIFLLFNFKFKTSVKSNLPIYNFELKLYRTNIINQIEKKLSGRMGIKKVVLIGIGGAGKTTIARRYAQNSDATLIWQIDSITNEKTFSSLQQLAFALSKTDIERNDLKAILSIENKSIRYGKFMSCLTQKLKKHSNWLLIYDNVESFQSIRKFFPYDVNVWGGGRVIITTRDSNISNNIFIPDDNIIFIPELSKSDRYSLFSNIIENGKLTNIDNEEKTKRISFLKQVPPFPLDVSVAAHYIKETNISYELYLDYLLKRNKTFILEQEKVLSDIGEYSNTRFYIIAACVKQIIRNNPDFKLLLFLISLIDSQNISREILLNYKSNILVDKFIHFLKKFSLITEQTLSVEEQVIDSISLHPSSQKIILSFLQTKIDGNEKRMIYNQISQSLTGYMLAAIAKGDIVKIKLIIRHVETFIKNTNPDIPVDIKLGNILGDCYMFIGEYAKAERLLQKILKTNNFQFQKNSEDLTETISYLGSLYRVLGKYDEALKYLEESSKLFIDQYGIQNTVTQKSLLNLAYAYRDLGKYIKAKDILEKMIDKLKALRFDNEIEIAKIKGELAYIYKIEGNYEKSLNCFQESLAVLKNFYGANNVKVAWIYINLGVLHRNMGDYKKSRDLLDYGYKIFSNHYGKDNVKIAWVLVQKGNIYRDIGIDKDTIGYFERAHEIYKDFYNIGHMRRGWSGAYLGVAYLKYGLLKKAIFLLEQSARMHKNYFGLDHVRTAWILCHLADAYIKTNNLSSAESFLNQAEKIYQDFYGQSHTKFASILLVKGHLNSAKGDMKLAEVMYNDALKIYENNSNIRRYICLEALGDLYSTLAKSSHSKDKEIYLALGKKAEHYYTQSLGVILNDFSEESTHIKRIRSKIK